jgi:predicted amidohydrolase
MDMGNSKFKLAMGQMLVEGGEAKANLDRAARMIENAAQEGCSVVVLPECLDLGWANPAAHDLARPIPGSSSDVLCQAARDSKIYVVAGLTERADGRLYDAALLISSDGQILVRHRKINLLTDVEGMYSVGDNLAVATTPLCTIGVDICADNFPDSLALGHALARMGAQILLSPCSWAVRAEHDNKQDPYGSLWKRSYSTLAKLYDMTIVGVSNVGRINEGAWKGRKCIGSSLTVGPQGQVLAEGPYGETAECLMTVPIEPLQRRARGTEIAQMLKTRGYEGP